MVRICIEKSLLQSFIPILLIITPQIYGGPLLWILAFPQHAALKFDSNDHRAANTGEVEKLEGLVTFADPVVVNADTTSITMDFNVGEGMHLSTSGGNTLFIGSGPFQATMTAN